MKSVKRKALRVKEIIFLLIVLFLILTAYPLPLTPTYAQESSPSADIKSKLETLKAGIASRAAQLKQEISTKLQNKSYTGSIKTISQTSITLASLTGPKVININQDTVYESDIAKVKYSFKNAKAEDYIAALGDIDDTNVLTAKRIILIPKQEAKKQIVWGQIITLGNSLVVKTKDSKNTKILLKNATTFQKGVEEIGIEKVKVNDFVIAVADENQQGVLTANYIYVTSQGGIIKSKKISTPSAQEATKSSEKSATNSSLKK